ncbi:hypothetical protein CDD82_4808 [Ophiocordyceps australis]|uniref:glycerol-3-phosphate dehydrogenase n=1 Tax=Ophiocordyceps australis TaxID=1399860 RepID=A0A2C5Z4T9_9HYPO|nr:hypothetical protein CDD82_4808 [Ophiocordyceps australis]
MDEPHRKPIVAPSSGAHIVLPAKLCPKGMGMLDAATSDGRVVFVLPWQGMTVAGTTDNACKVEKEPVAVESDVDFILREVSKLLAPDAALGRSDVLATWSGIRPLVKDPKAGNTESLVRSHLVTVSPSGLLTCAGGKWTTYRQMAEDAVDEAIKAFDLTPRALQLGDISGAGLPGLATTGVCQTRTTPVVGAHGFSTQLPAQLMEVYPNMDPDVARHLATNYGDRAWTLAADASSPCSSGAKRLAPGFPYIEAEVRHSVRHESACTAPDVLARRMRLAFLDTQAALRALPRVIDIMAGELGWDAARCAHEWRTTVHFLRSMGLPEDRMGVTRDQIVAQEARMRQLGKTVDRRERGKSILAEEA